MAATDKGKAVLRDIAAGRETDTAFAALTTANSAVSDSTGTAGFANDADRTAVVNLVNNNRTRIAEIEQILKDIGLL